MRKFRHNITLKLSSIHQSVNPSIHQSVSPSVTSSSRAAMLPLKA